MGKPVITSVNVQNGCLVSMEVDGCPFARGKVRDILDLGDELLLVATDRISAFDRVLPTPIPDRGRVLTQLSEFWLKKTAGIVPNAMVTTNIDEICRRVDVGDAKAQLAGRSMVMRKGKTFLIEGVVRGYLYGSGWKEYQQTQTVCGIKLPAGLVKASQLPEPIFTPSTKAEAGFHDENITFQRACQIVGALTAIQLSEYALTVYKYAHDYAAARGIIIADTKFEFAVIDGKVVLVDEVLTPDSSRFWPANLYVPGRDQSSHDKQGVRDYLEQLCDKGVWDKSENNIPVLPPEIVTATSVKYREALRLLTTP